MTVDAPPADVRDVEVAILGGGVAGLSLARALAHAGTVVALFEAKGPEGTWHAGEPWPAGGASSLPVALVNPWRGRKGEAHPDDLAGLATTRRWARALEDEDLSSGATFEGMLRIPSSARQARDWQTRAEAEPTLRWLEAQDVPAGYHAPFGAMKVIDGGVIHPERWLGALAASAVSKGARLHTGMQVASLEGAPRGCWTLRTTGGRQVARASVVVSALGADPQPTLATTSPSFVWPTWIRTRGEEVHLTGDLHLPYPVAGGVYGAMGAREGLWIGGGHRDAETDDATAAENLRDAFAWSFPEASNAKIRRVWTGVRAKQESARPDIREIASNLWVFGAFAGRGFLCSALEAERWLAQHAGS